MASNTETTRNKPGARGATVAREEPFDMPDDGQQTQALKDFLEDEEPQALNMDVGEADDPQDDQAQDDGASEGQETQVAQAETAIAPRTEATLAERRVVESRMMPWDMVEDNGEPSGYAALDMANPGYIGYVIQENLGGRELTPQDFDIIKVPAGGSRVWNVPTPDGDQSQDAVTGIIIHFTSPKAWWSVDLEDSDGQTPPDCASKDGVRGYGKRVVPGVLDDTEIGYHDCATCPLNQWDTGKGGKGKACKEKRMLYLMQEDSTLPTVVQVPATSLRTVDTFIKSLSKGRDPRPYWQVRADLYLEQDKSGPFPFSRISPRRGESLDFAHVNRMMAYRNAIKTIIDAADIESKQIQQDAADQ